MLVLGALTFAAISNARIARITAKAAQRNAAIAENRPGWQNRPISVPPWERKRADAAAIAAKKRQSITPQMCKRKMAKAFAAQQPKQFAALATLAIQRNKQERERLAVAAPRVNIVWSLPMRRRVLPQIWSGQHLYLFWLFLIGTCKRRSLAMRKGVTQININAIDDCNWHVEAVRPIGEMMEGTTDRLHFRARADSPARRGNQLPDQPGQLSQHRRSSAARTLEYRMENVPVCRWPPRRHRTPGRIHSRNEGWKGVADRHEESIKAAR